MFTIDFANVFVLQHKKTTFVLNCTPEECYLGALSETDPCHYPYLNDSNTNQVLVPLSESTWWSPCLFQNDLKKTLFLMFSV